MRACHVFCGISVFAMPLWTAYDGEIGADGNGVSVAHTVVVVVVVD